MDYGARLEAAWEPLRWTKRLVITLVGLDGEADGEAVKNGKHPHAKPRGKNELQAMFTSVRSELQALAAQATARAEVALEALDRVDVNAPVTSARR